MAVEGGPAGPPLWEPTDERRASARVTEFVDWLRSERGLELEGYQELQRWSSQDLEGFWSAVWEFFDVQADGDPAPVLAATEMPGAEWFPRASLNYAEHVIRGADPDETAILHCSELRDLDAISWRQLRDRVATCAAGLRAHDVGRGDRVVAYMPNVPETVIAFLATASIGAVWSCCSPDFGAASVLDRFAQIEPSFLFAVDGYRYGGKDFDRRAVIDELREGLPTLREVATLPYLEPASEASAPAGGITWEELLDAGAGAEPRFELVPFDHPLWVLYSSGTTGLPKAIVHGHGGILLEHLKQFGLQLDARPGDRLFWFTTTGWMMWNFLVSGLLMSATIVLFDGNPGYPDLNVLWDLAARTRLTTFGTSASYLSACMKDGIEPATGRDLGALTAVGSTGSPLAPEGFDWVYEELGDDTWLFSTSGGTDVCTAFVGAVPLQPVFRGELQGPSLGVAMEAWDEEGRSVVDEVGELVITAPMPSMPIGFWNDPDGRRYRESYFEMYPGVWRHGDWIEITSRGGAVIHGRSDSTINRGGVRMGTAEIYRAVLSMEEVLDALVVDLPMPGTEGWIPLFLVLREGVELDRGLETAVARQVRERCSPRHTPDRTFAIAEVPRTLSGKALELPVKRILMGVDPGRAVSRDSLANPAALDYFVALGARLRTEFSSDRA